ncbi:hypothetical protein HCN44_001220 [Aphidius gifuensis]|uniref:Tr-type G domain-containing protein n=1 Tax=Aphidius gifuensis TaxID=684658 RepID=A0A834XKQ9_APHGI|nr:hypothetical protein HCN44_001220 [Aphidius gifuensis]
MSRHRDVRALKYSDEYDGFDDIYGHSVEDDIAMSPGDSQFIYDRNKSADVSSFMIQEDDEEPTRPELSELDTARLMSCIEVIKNVIGDNVTEATMTNEIIKANFDAEIALNKILNPTTSTNLVNLGAIPKYTKSSVTTPTSIKVVPSTTKTIVKGFNIGNNENENYLSPVPGSSRSQSPNFNSQTNSPRQQRKDEQKKLCLSKSTTPRCQSPSSGCVTPEFDNRINKIYQEDKRDAMLIYKKNRDGLKEQLNLVVVGHVDAGKSTLLGRLLCDLKQIPQKLIHKYQQENKKVAYAWVFDETSEERERGITMDIGYSKFETDSKVVTLLDAPGHKDFIPNMITGATQADVALLVVDATRGEFETGFDSGGQTREHALLLRSLGVSQIAVVINKLDTVEWSKDRFDEIVNKMSVFLKQAGFGNKVSFVPCSGLTGENLVTSSKIEALSSWYSGPNLLQVIDSFDCPERPISKPFRFSVNDIYKGTGSGYCISGHVESGMVAVADKVLILPPNETAIVKGIQVDEMTITNAFAGDNVALTLSGIDTQNISIGDIICSISKPISVTTTFQAHIVIFSILYPITKGLNVVIHSQSLVEPAIITKLITQLHRSTGEVIKNKPRCLPKNSSAIVEITTTRSICLELYKDIKQLGRIMIRLSGTTIAAGLVTKIK